MARKRKLANGASAYTIMWLIVMFDIPVGTKDEMKRATQFRNSLLDLGFSRKQFSVYIRHCENMEKAENIANKVGKNIVENAHVSILFITDRQYGMTREFFGRATCRNEQLTTSKYKQLLLF